MSRRTSIRRALERIASGGIAALRTVERRLPGRGGPEPLEVLIYPGFGTTRRVLVLGRVAEWAEIPPEMAGDGKWRNLMRLYQRVAASGAADARVRVDIPGVGGTTSREVVADDEGYVRAWLELDAPLDAGVLRHEITMTLLGDAGGGVPVGRGTVMVPPGDAEFGVVSDLDDTVIQSHVDDFLTAIRDVALGNAHTRVPFPGVARLYHELQLGPDGRGHNPVFYVSSSPWELLGAIQRFLELQDIPSGPILLRDWDVRLSALRANRLVAFKLPLVREILALYPSLPFVLIGDSTQRDPEIYRHIVRDYGSRVLAVYIRNVKAAPDRIAAIESLAAEVTRSGSRLVVVRDSVDALADARAAGLVR